MKFPLKIKRKIFGPKKEKNNDSDTNSTDANDSKKKRKFGIFKKKTKHD
jgi:hypothetical protein